MTTENPNQMDQRDAPKAKVVALKTAAADVGGRTIQSVERALNILEIIAQERDGITISELAEIAGLNISTCHHLVATLVKKGFATHLGRIQGYRIGPRLQELVEISEGERDPDALLADDLKALSERLGHGVQFAVLRDTSLMTKLSFVGQEKEVIEPDEVEKMTAMHATATGKAILAWIPDTELVRIISANGMRAYTDKTITSLSGLVEELRLVRRLKYSVDNEEFRDGIVCIGATIREGAGAVIGAISVTAASHRATDEYRKYLIKEMITAANTYSNKLRNMKS